MAYNISLTNSSILTSVADGSYDNTSTSLTLIGKNFPSYGTFLNENFVHMLENFANSNSPTSPLPGQLWWDSTNGILKINSSTTKGDANAVWKSIAASTSSSSEPTNSIPGDLWWDSGKSQLNVYNGSRFVVIGPAFPASTGTTASEAGVITGTDQQSHIVIKFYVNNQLIAILSKDATFTPSDQTGGGLNNHFPTIKPGFNFSNQTNPSLLYWGDANQALNLKLNDGTIIPASSFLRADATVPTSAKLQVLTDDGIDVGATAQGSLNINQPTNDFRIISNRAGNNIKFYTKVGATSTLVATMSGADGKMTVQSDPTTALGVATKQYVDSSNSSMKTYVDTVSTSSVGTALARNGGNTITGNISPDATANLRSLGDSSSKFANVWATTFRGTAVSAEYADLAEMYITDQVYEVGTVMVVGGEAEVTQSMCNQVAVGVISSKPAFLMNEKSPGQPIALKGRVKVKVIGPVKKGDGLVAGDFGNGITTYHPDNTPDPTSGLQVNRVFASALESSDNPDSKLVECIIL